MSWVKVVLTRWCVGEVVHVVLKVVQPGLKVDHFLVVLIVFFVTTAFGVAPGSDPSTGEPR
jgi:hypothetical protein